MANLHVFITKLGEHHYRIQWVNAAALNRSEIIEALRMAAEHVETEHKTAVRVFGRVVT